MKPLNVKLATSPQSSFKYKKIRLTRLDFNWHCHPEYEIMFMAKSNGKRFIGDNIAYYNEGDLFFICPNLPHTWYSPAKTNGKKNQHEAILIQFRENITGLNVQEIPEFSSIHHLLTNSSRGFQFLKNTCNIVSKKMIKMESQEGLERLMTLYSILDILGKADSNERKELSSSEFNHCLPPRKQNRIDKVCTHINQNYKETLHLEDAASFINMSKTAFSRFFKKSTGKTFINYVNELRIGRVCKLLIESEKTVAEICYEVGFNNLSNFNRRFFELQQMSPREYRQEFTSKKYYIKIKVR